MIVSHYQQQNLCNLFLYRSSVCTTCTSIDDSAPFYVCWVLDNDDDDYNDDNDGDDDDDDYNDDDDNNNNNSSSNNTIKTAAATNITTLLTNSLLLHLYYQNDMFTWSYIIISVCYIQQSNNWSGSQVDKVHLYPCYKTVFTISKSSVKCLCV